MEVKNMTTKYPYLKEILKTTAKVALIAGATVVATPYAFGFAAGLFNLMAAGYVAGYAVAGAGTYLGIKTLVKDIFTIRKHVKEQQREEYLDEQLAKLKKGQKKDHLQRADRTKEKQNQKEDIQKPINTKIKWKKFNPLFWKKAKEYDRAA